MSLTIKPDLEAKIKELALGEGVSVEEYLERLVKMEEEAYRELEELALEGLNSGSAEDVGPSYWEEKHRRLDARLNDGSR